MPISGEQFIDDVGNRGFWWIAGQLGASEFQIAEVTGFPAITIRYSNKHIGQLLAFPYHDRRGSDGPTLAQVYALHARWKENTALLGDSELLHPVTLNHFRQLTDPYLQHDHGDDTLA